MNEAVPKPPSKSFEISLFSTQQTDPYQQTKLETLPSYHPSLRCAEHVESRIFRFELQEGLVLCAGRSPQKGERWTKP